MNNKKFKWIRNILLLLLGLLILFCILLYLSITKIKKIDVSGIERANQDLILGIDAVKWNKEDKLFIIEGYAFIDKIGIDQNNSRVLIFDNITNECYEMPTQMIVREDVATNYKENKGVDLKIKNSGFKSVFKSKFLKDNWSNYTIGLLYNNDNHKYIVESSINLGDYMLVE